MIRTIQTIKNFGVFSDFRWPTGLTEFKKRNLLYGWNYSGKTTLSRIFRAFEQRQAHPDFAGAQLQLRMDDGAVHDLSSPDSVPPLRVFNSDFVRDNLSFETGSATPILVLGAEDISKRDTLKEKLIERDALRTVMAADRKAKQEKQFAIERALTNSARDLIKNPLAVPNYDRKRFEPKVAECKGDPDKHILSEDTFRDVQAVYQSREKKPALRPKVARLSSLSRLGDETASLLIATVAANNPILRLKDDPEVEHWVDEGRRLHDQQTVCQFCGQVLPPDLLSRLRQHFSAEYENLKAATRELAATLRKAGEERVECDHKSDFYPEFGERFAEEKKRLDVLIDARTSALLLLADALDRKQTRAFSSVDCPEVEDSGAAIASAVDAINAFISDHNKRTEAFEQRRADTFGQIERHYAALFVRDHEYVKRLEEMESLDKAIGLQTEQVGDLTEQIRRLEESLSQDAKGAQRINELLAAYFGKADLRIDVSVDKRFEIIRGNAVAKNLSEGEKTAIAFAYFITRVHDGRVPLSESTVVVDDPVSSLDANHLFNTYALVKTRLAGCRQLFVLTHSFEFYNLLKEWVFEDEKKKDKPQNDWKTWSVLLVRRVDNETAVIEEIPSELLTFKSEYHYLFSKLYRLDSAGSYFDDLLSLPNVIRRFMEAFGGIMIPLSTGLHKKMERLFSNEIERERVWKFINHYSHNTTITRSLTIPDTSECKAVVEACLKAVKNWNAQYFADLVSEVNPEEKRDEVERGLISFAIPA